MTSFIDLKDIKIDRQKVLELGRFFSRYEGTCLLYSGLGELQRTSRSFLCLFPIDKIELSKAASNVNPWDVLKSNLSTPKVNHSFPEWIGFLAYEMGAYAPQHYQEMISVSDLENNSSIPLFFFQRCGIILEINHEDDGLRIMISDDISKLDPLQRQWADSLQDPRFWPGFLRRLGGPAIGGAGTTTVYKETVYELCESESKASYHEKILKAQEWIREGYIYQLNLSQQFIFKGSGDNFKIFEELANSNPAPFSAYLSHKNFTVICSSPELFLRKNGSSLLTRPIKGTMPRGVNSEEDDRNKELLLASEKERAELLMIVDLMRNDLGKISQTGSVVTEKIWECEAYTNVFHLVSTIRSELLPEQDPVDIIRSCFPGGSITGCPKLTAMECIAELEKRPRGIYTGAIGYFSGDGNFDFNIAIRTIVQQGDYINVQLGGAVVIDSDPTSEYEETLHKGKSIFGALHSELQR